MSFTPKRYPASLRKQAANCTTTRLTTLNRLRSGFQTCRADLTSPVLHNRRVPEPFGDDGTSGVVKVVPECITPRFEVALRLCSVETTSFLCIGEVK